MAVLASAACVSAHGITYLRAFVQLFVISYVFARDIERHQPDLLQWWSTMSTDDSTVLCPSFATVHRHAASNCRQH
eukprot:1157263-Amphidinium_carterae.1